MRNYKEKVEKIQGEGNNFYNQKQCNSCTFLEPLATNDREMLKMHLHVHLG